MKIPSNKMIITHKGNVLFEKGEKNGEVILYDFMENKDYIMDKYALQAEFELGKAMLVSYLKEIVDSKIKKGETNFNPKEAKALYDLAKFFHFNYEDMMKETIAMYTQQGERKAIEDKTETLKEVERNVNFLYDTNTYNTANRSLVEPEKIEIRKEVIIERQRLERRKLIDTEILYNNFELMDELIMKEHTYFQSYVEEELYKLLTDKRFPRSIKRKMLPNTTIDVTKFDKYWEEIQRKLFVINYFHTHTSHYDRDNYTIYYTFDYLESPSWRGGRDEKRREIFENLAKPTNIFDITSHPQYVNLVLMYEKYWFLTDGIWILSWKEAKEEFDKAMYKEMEKEYKSHEKSLWKDILNTKEWLNMPLWDNAKRLGIEIKSDKDKNKENFIKIRIHREIENIKDTYKIELPNLLENIKEIFGKKKESVKNITYRTEYIMAYENEQLWLWLIGLGKWEDEEDIVKVNMDIYAALLKKYPEKKHKIRYISGWDSMIEQFITFENEKGEIVGGLMPLR